MLSACPRSDVFRRFANLFPLFWQRRSGCLGPFVMLASLMRMAVLGANGYDRTMREMKEHLSQEVRRAKHVSASAFSQARANLTATFCRTAFEQTRDLCRTARECRVVDYDARYVLAFDGTKLPLPAYATMREHFGCPKQAPQGPQASLTVLWDVGANQPVDWRLGPYRECERLHAADMAACVPEGALVLADCNFASRRMMYALIGQKADWLMHIRSAGSGTLHEVAAFVASGKDDDQIALVDRDHHGRARREHGEVTVRLLRLTLPNGEIRVFVTSLLDGVRHSREGLIALYAQRWRVETAFREMKLWNGLQRFHARSVLGITQEVTAVMLFQLLASELEAQARIAHDAGVAADAEPPVAQVRTPDVRFNRRTVGYAAIDILMAAASGSVEDVFRYSIGHLWRTRQTPKHGRSFPRIRKSAATGFKFRGPTGRGRPTKLA